jgi:cyclopropane fatty-acyl-phospholipid synthase-like methyltransferase
MAMSKPYSEACERNQGPILEVLRDAFADRRKVLEVGGGTGQHAAHFARHLPHLIWQTTDVAQHLPGIQQWIDEAGLANLPDAIVLDINQASWPQIDADAAFTANTLHIISWPEVERLFERVGALLPAGGVLAVYGPFKYGGAHTAQSNARFDLMLRERDPESGLRDFEAVNELAARNGLTLVRDQAMPANNRTVVWVRS